MFVRKSGHAVFAVAMTLMLTCTGLRAEESAAQVLFVCEHGNVKSVMAASYFNQLAMERGLRMRAISRGSTPDATSVPASIAAGLRSDGVDVGDFRPAAISAADIAASTQIVAIGTQLPNGIDTSAVTVEHWDDVPPATVDYAAARDSLRDHIEQLLERMSRDSSRKD